EPTEPCHRPVDRSSSFRVSFCSPYGSIPNHRLCSTLPQRVKANPVLMEARSAVRPSSGKGRTPPMEASRSSPPGAKSNAFPWLLLVCPSLTNRPEAPCTRLVEPTWTTHPEKD